MPGPVCYARGGEQAALARSAGIDAFCVYHYWFGGRRLLEALNQVIRGTTLYDAAAFAGVKLPAAAQQEASQAPRRRKSR